VERKEIQAHGAEKKKQLEAMLAERERIIAPVPQDLRDLYARIAKRHNGTAMAEARDGQCRGCGMRVLPHILQELRTETNEELYRCESCGLILYTLEPIPVANSSDAGKNASAASTNSLMPRRTPTPRGKSLFGDALQSRNPQPLLIAQTSTAARGAIRVRPLTAWSFGMAAANSSRN